MPPSAMGAWWVRINTRDYASAFRHWLKRAQTFCIDSSEGFSEWRSPARSHGFVSVTAIACVGAGNVADREGFLFGKGRRRFCKGRHRRRLNLHHTREQKGIAADIPL